MPLYYCKACHQQQSEYHNADQCHCTTVRLVTSNKVNTIYRPMPLNYSMVCHQQQSEYHNTDQCHCTTLLFVTDNKVNTIMQSNGTILLDSFAPQHRSMTLSYCMVCYSNKVKHNTDQCHCTTVWFVTNSNNKANTEIQRYATVRFVTNNKVNILIQINATVLPNGWSPKTN